MYLVFILLIISMVVLQINYQSISLLDLTNDYKKSVVDFYNAESEIRKLIYDQNIFKDNFEMKIRNMLQYKNGNMDGRFKNIKYNISVLEDKKVKIRGNIKNILFDSQITVLNDLYNNNNGLIRLDKKDLNLKDNFKIIKNYNFTGIEKYQEIQGLNEALAETLLNFDNINLTYINDDIKLSTNIKNSKRYTGVIIVNGDIKFVDDFTFSGILISSGSIIVEEDVSLDINGSIICNNFINKGNFSTEYEYTNKLIYGKYIENFINLNIHNLKVY